MRSGRSTPQSEPRSSGRYWANSPTGAAFRAPTRSNLIAYTSFECVTETHGPSAYYGVTGAARDGGRGLKNLPAPKEERRTWTRDWSKPSARCALSGSDMKSRALQAQVVDAPTLYTSLWAMQTCAGLQPPLKHWKRQHRKLSVRILRHTPPPRPCNRNHLTSLSAAPRAAHL